MRLPVSWGEVWPIHDTFPSLSPHTKEQGCIASYMYSLQYGVYLNYEFFTGVSLSVLWFYWEFLCPLYFFYILYSATLPCCHVEFLPVSKFGGRLWLMSTNQAPVSFHSFGNRMLGIFGTYKDIHHSLRNRKPYCLTLQHSGVWVVGLQVWDVVGLTDVQRLSEEKKVQMCI